MANPATGFDIHIEVVSELNWRGHHMARYRRLKGHKDAAFAACLAHIGYRRDRAGDFTIRLVRMKAKGQRDFDDDNLRGAFKGVRDGIAKYLGIDDGSKRLTWVYGQEKGGMDKSTVWVEISEILLRKGEHERKNQKGQPG